ncbi:pantetheine-phosphate adenylyltransferase [Clostridium sp. BJN0001]|uniref:pantetheine-phosphate adenylyltransferase n=1 Tax=Clostridium sp. BJN0001 TaxID=2930219 RepID=UPI001FD2218C|nr:pantetheine-phosphate adenylyltransferase [Clostridium sp. BJN0001]
MKTAVYPGSFDPITNGHFDIIKRGAKIFDKVIVAVLINIDKRHLFNIEERVELIKKVVKGIDNVEVVCFDGLLVEFMRRNNINVILKGLRTTGDFDYELQMALVNSELEPEIETVCMMARAENIHISSSCVKQIAEFGGSIDKFVPKQIVSEILKKIG